MARNREISPVEVIKVHVVRISHANFYSADKPVVLMVVFSRRDKKFAHHKISINYI